MAGWTIGNAFDQNLQSTVTHAIVALRDPLDRWISGISQYVHTYILYPHGPNTPHLDHEVPSSHYDYGMSVPQFINQYTQLTERLIFDVINRFDDHVWPQVELLQDLLPEVNRTYFYIDDNFDTKLSDYLEIDLNSVNDRNSSDNNDAMKQLKTFFTHRFELRPALAQRVKNAYADDYKLIEQIKK